MNIRIRKESIDRSVKKVLKQWNFVIKFDRKWKVYVLKVPSNIELVECSNLPNIYLLMTKNRRHLGNIYSNPLAPDGALLTFAP